MVRPCLLLGPCLSLVEGLSHEPGSRVIPARSGCTNLLAFVRTPAFRSCGLLTCMPLYMGLFCADLLQAGHPSSKCATTCMFEV